MIPKVILIGGTSHVGKSSFGEVLAAHLGFNLLSTDQFARHPGRPWRDDDSELPIDVSSYFSLHEDNVLLSDVFTHYQDNVWPIVHAIITTRINNSFDGPLVLEGSAILPYLVAEFSGKPVQALWLVADSDLLISRIHDNSDYHNRNESEQLLIDAFVRRSLAFDAKLRALLSAEGESFIHATDDLSYQEHAISLEKSFGLT